MTAARGRNPTAGRGWVAGQAAVDGERLLLALVAAYVLLLCAAPLLRLFGEVFASGAADGWRTIADALSSRAARRATWNTIESGLAGMVLSLLLGGGVALLVGLTDIRWKPAVVFLAILPLLIPAQIAALAWLELLGPSSLLYRLVGFELPPGTRNPLYSREGVILLMGIEHAPMVFLAARAGLRALPAELVEAARSAGAGPLRIVATIVLPLMRPALVAGAALAFVSAIGNFGVPALLGIPGRYTVLSTLIYQRLSGFGPTVLGQVAVLAMVLALLAALGLAVQAWAMRRSSAAATGRGAGTAPFRLGRKRPLVEAALWGGLLLITVLPLTALVATSLIPALGVPLTWSTWTLDNYGFALGHPVTARALRNSALLALGAACAGAIIAVPLGYLAVRRRSRLARVLDVLADAPYALPGIVLAIAAILLFLRPLPVLGVGLYNTFWIILVAYCGRFLALSLRPTIAGLHQIEPALEEAAQSAGAGPLRRLGTVILPLAAPAAAAGGLLVFLTAFNELTVSVLLWSSGNETLGVVVFALYDEGNSTEAAAVAVIAIAATLGLAMLATLFARRLPPGVLPWQA